MRFVRLHRDPWFSLGVHIDHRAPYVAIHLPGVRVEIGRGNEPAHACDLSPDLWLLSMTPISDFTRDRLRRALEDGA